MPGAMICDLANCFFFLLLFSPHNQLLFQIIKNNNRYYQNIMEILKISGQQNKKKRKGKKNYSGVHPLDVYTNTTKFSKNRTKKTKKKKKCVEIAYSGDCTNCGNTTEATTLLQQFVEKNKKTKTYTSASPLFLPF